MLLALSAFDGSVLASESEDKSLDASSVRCSARCMTLRGDQQIELRDCGEWGVQYCFSSDAVPDPGLRLAFSEALSTLLDDRAYSAPAVLDEDATYRLNELLPDRKIRRDFADFVARIDTSVIWSDGHAHGAQEVLMSEFLAPEGIERGARLLQSYVKRCEIDRIGLFELAELIATRAELGRGLYSAIEYCIDESDSSWTLGVLAAAGLSLIGEECTANRVLERVVEASAGEAVVQAYLSSEVEPRLHRLPKDEEELKTLLVQWMFRESVN